MQLILVGVGILLVPTLVLAGLVWVGLRLSRRNPKGYWKKVLVLHAVLVPIHAFLVIPAALGFLAPRFVSTRPDEEAYAGPRIDSDGTWRIQSRESLRSEAGGMRSVDPEVLAKSQALSISFPSTDGTKLNAYLVPPPEGEPVASVVMVHGLFRNAMELETVGGIFRDLGAEVCLLELRNHGGSDGTLFTFGLRESEDVEAAVRYLRARPGREDVPLVLFGVSLGTAAVALAAPRIKDLAGVVLDAPMDNLLASAHRMLAVSRGRVVGIAEPFRSLVIRSIELWSGYRMSEVRPIEALASLPADLPILIIGAGRDLRMPPESVAKIYQTLTAPPGVKDLWICATADHGHVWEADLLGYETHVARFFAQLRTR